jgi:hypothetical protein
MSVLKRISDAFEVTLYELDERDQWLFRLLEWCNEICARVVFRGVRRDAHAIDDTIEGRSRGYRIRFLRPDDLNPGSAIRSWNRPRG